MELLAAHGEAMAEFDRRVAAIGDDQWDAGTPCIEWNVRDVVNHLVSEQYWAPWLLRGATLDEVGDRFDGDQLGTDPKGAWGNAAKAAREAWTAPDALDRTVHVTGGQIDATEYGWQMTTDLAVHGWDLARAIGTSEAMHPELAETLLAIWHPLVEQVQGLGIFAPPVAVSADTDARMQLLASLGRDPR